MTQRKKQIIAPEEWDFRSLSKDELYAASKYEYARELVTTAQARKARALLKKRDKRAPKYVLNELDWIVPNEVRTASPTMKDVPDHLMYFAGNFPLFPRPWLKLTKKTRARYVKQAGPPILGTQRYLFQGFDTIQPTEIPPERMVELMEADAPKRGRYGIFGWHFAQVNWVQSNKKIIADFSRWLKLIRPRGVNPVVVKGRKAQPNDHHRLRWLAAYRWAKNGVKYTTAKPRIDSYIGPKRKDPHGLIPDFGTPSSWQTAVKKAEDILRQLASSPI